MFTSVATWLSSPAAFGGVAALLGLSIGSFLNVVIHRLPRMMEREWRAQCAELAGHVVEALPRYNLAVPGSACPACGHRISVLENIPVFSYLVLRGRCSACHTRIGMRYPLVELLTGLLLGYAGWHFGFGFAGVAAMVFLASLVALSFIDFDTQYLPDSITLPLLWAGLLINVPGTFVDLRSAVIGAAAGYLSLWTVYWLFKFATGKEGMGFGDFKLLAAIGAWLGWKVLPVVILGSSFVGALVGIALIILAKRGREVPIPFGPYIAAAGALAMFVGNRVIDYYLNVLA
jgi:leader peptidase (prepilin peptidase)/N-methyltransferase